MATTLFAHPRGISHHEDMPAPPPCPATPLVGALLDHAQATHAAGVFKALADPVRLRLLALISAHADGQACVCELAGAFALTQPTISYHLRTLRQAGLIEAERRGTWVYYRVVPTRLHQVAELLAGRSCAAPPVVRAAATGGAPCP